MAILLLLLLSLAVIAATLMPKVVSALQRRKPDESGAGFETMLYDLYDLGGFLPVDISTITAAAKCSARAQGVLANSYLELNPYQSASLVGRYMEGFIDGLQAMPVDWGMQNTKIEAQRGVPLVTYSATYFVGRRHGALSRESQAAQLSASASELSSFLLSGLFLDSMARNRLP